MVISKKFDDALYRMIRSSKKNIFNNQCGDWCPYTSCSNNCSIHGSDCDWCKLEEKNLSIEEKCRIIINGYCLSYQEGEGTVEGTKSRRNQLASYAFSFLEHLMYRTFDFCYLSFNETEKREIEEALIKSNPIERLYMVLAVKSYMTDEEE